MGYYKIIVTIENQWGEVVARAAAPVDGMMAEAIEPIKVSDSAIPMFDTPDSVVRHVKPYREHIAKVLTPSLSTLLLDAMEARDLFNGYTKAENKQFRKG